MTTIFAETDRLILRQFRDADLGPMVEMYSDPLTVEFLTPDNKPPSRADVFRGMCVVEGHRALRGFSFFAVEEKASGSFVGRIGPLRPETWPDLEIGWGVHPAHRGKGYAVEAARAALAWSFARFAKQQRIIHLIHPDNVGSAAVAKSLGATITGQWSIPDAYEVNVWESKRP